jgi:hypothetical protein
MMVAFCRLLQDDNRQLRIALDEHQTGKGINKYELSNSWKMTIATE